MLVYDHSDQHTCIKTSNIGKGNYEDWNQSSVRSVEFQSYSLRLRIILGFPSSSPNYKLAHQVDCGTWWVVSRGQTGLKPILHSNSAEGTWTTFNLTMVANKGEMFSSLSDRCWVLMCFMILKKLYNYDCSFSKSNVLRTSALHSRLCSTWRIKDTDLGEECACWQVYRHVYPRKNRCRHTHSPTHSPNKHYRYNSFATIAPRLT